MPVVIYDNSDHDIPGKRTETGIFHLTETEIESAVFYTL